MEKFKIDTIGFEKLEGRIHPSIQHKLKRIDSQQQFKLRHQEAFDSLTRREVEIVFNIVQGLTAPQIAEKLFISIHTVGQHRKNINRKLQIRSFSDLFQFALAFNLI